MHNENNNIMKMIKACLFDLDGVVFDTEPLYTEFWKSIFNEFYPTEQDLELKIKGQTLTQIYNHYFSGPAGGDNTPTGRLRATNALHIRRRFCRLLETVEAKWCKNLCSNEFQ